MKHSPSTSVLGKKSLGLHTTGKGFSLWCLDQDSEHVQQRIHPELYEATDRRYLGQDLSAHPLYLVKHVPEDMRTPSLVRWLGENLDWAVALKAGECGVQRGTGVPPQEVQHLRQGRPTSI